MAWKVLTDDVAFESALEAFRKRVPMTDEQFQALREQNHERAFVVSHVNALDLVTQVWETLKAAIQGDIEFRDFKKTMSQKLIEAWGIPSPKVASHRVATTFRNAVQTSFNHGRWQQMNDPDLLELRPYRMFDAIKDARTTKVCVHCNGTILAADDPWWNSHVPPLHHACRSHVRSLRASVAKRKGITTSPTNAAGQKGFGNRPEGVSPSVADVTPDLRQYPAELAAIYKEKTASVPMTTEAPKVSKAKVDYLSVKQTQSDAKEVKRQIELVKKTASKYENASLIKYVDPDKDTYKKIREAEIKGLDNEYWDHVENIQNVLHRAIARSKPVRLYRGMRLPQAALDRLLVADSFDLMATSSFSNSPAEAYDFATGAAVDFPNDGNLPVMITGKLKAVAIPNSPEDESLIPAKKLRITKREYFDDPNYGKIIVLHVAD